MELVENLFCVDATKLDFENFLITPYSIGSMEHLQKMIKLIEKLSKSQKNLFIRCQSPKNIMKDKDLSIFSQQ